jgi:hypothetical protein
VTEDAKHPSGSFVFRHLTLLPARFFVCTVAAVFQLFAALLQLIQYDA